MRDLDLDRGEGLAGCWPGASRRERDQVGDRPRASVE